MQCKQTADLKYSNVNRTWSGSPTRDQPLLGRARPISDTSDGQQNNQETGQKRVLRIVANSKSTLIVQQMCPPQLSRDNKESARQLTVSQHHSAGTHQNPLIFEK